MSEQMRMGEAGKPRSLKDRAEQGSPINNRIRVEFVTKRRGFRDTSPDLALTPMVFDSTLHPKRKLDLWREHQGATVVEAYTASMHVQDANLPVQDKPTGMLFIYVRFRYRDGAEWERFWLCNGRMDNCIGRVEGDVKVWRNDRVIHDSDLLSGGQPVQCWDRQGYTFTVGRPQVFPNARAGAYLWRTIKLRELPPPLNWIGPVECPDAPGGEWRPQYERQVRTGLPKWQDIIALLGDCPVGYLHDRSKHSVGSPYNGFYDQHMTVFTQCEMAKARDDKDPALLTTQAAILEALTAFDSAHVGCWSPLLKGKYIVGRSYWLFDDKGNPLEAGKRYGYTDIDRKAGKPALLIEGRPDRGSRQREYVFNEMFGREGLDILEYTAHQYVGHEMTPTAWEYEHQSLQTLEAAAILTGDPVAILGMRLHAEGMLTLGGNRAGVTNSTRCWGWNVALMAKCWNYFQDLHLLAQLRLYLTWAEEMKLNTGNLSAFLGRDNPKAQTHATTVNEATWQVAVALHGAVMGMRVDPDLHHGRWRWESMAQYLWSVLNQDGLYDSKRGWIDTFNAGMPQGLKGIEAMAWQQNATHPNNDVSWTNSQHWILGALADLEIELPNEPGLRERVTEVWEQTKDRQIGRQPIMGRYAWTLWGSLYAAAMQRGIAGVSGAPPVAVRIDPLMAAPEPSAPDVREAALAAIEAQSRNSSVGETALAVLEEPKQETEA